MANSSYGDSEVFLALSKFFVSDATVGETLLRVSELACVVAPADFAGISMMVEGKARTGVFTDPAAPEIEEAQYRTGRGPCLDAFRHQTIYRIDSTADETRWPEFARTAADYGIASTLSVPIVARGDSTGALNLYSRAPAAFDEEATQRVETFAEQAAFVLANTQVYWDARQLSEGLNQALQSRATIDYAIGIIMAGGGRSPDEAFQVLVRASQRENRKLRDIAAEMVERTQQRTSHGDSQGDAYLRPR